MRKEILNASEVYREILDKYELKTLKEQLEVLLKNIDDFKLKILFVGGFSAGKSALINAVLGCELLEENQMPETAIASEIFFDTEEYIEGISEDKVDRYSVEESDTIDNSKYDYLIWHLTSDNLAKMKDIVLVDMPGFNSGISEHNKAILRYAGKGNAYILVIDCEEGAIKQNISNFIQEIKNYDNNLSIALTKTDLKLDEDVEQIKGTIESNAVMCFGSHVPVIATSKYDEKAGDKIVSLVNEFDKEEIFSQEFTGETYEIGVKCLDSMEVYRKSLVLETGNFDKEIQRHENSKNELVKRLENEKSKLERRFRDNVGPSIMADVQNALYANTETLANSLKAGEQAFSMTVNNILRPVLMQSTQNYVEQSFGKFIAELDLSSIDASIQDINVNALGKYKQANEKIQATSAIAPWLELVLIFLPDIISFFSSFNKNNDLQNKVSNEIIPQIINKMKPEIDKSLIDMKDEMIEQVEQDIQKLIDSEIEAIQKAEEYKKRETQDYKMKLADVTTDIDKVNKIIEGLMR